MISLARKHFFLRRAPAHFWASEFSTIPTARGDGVFGQGRVFGHMSGNATNSLLKNCFGSPFRAAKRRGTSLFVGFWRAVIPYCAHSSTFEILFQQAANQEPQNNRWFAQRERDARDSAHEVCVARQKQRRKTIRQVAETRRDQQYT